MQLICAFSFAYAKSRFSYDAAQIMIQSTMCFTGRKYLSIYLSIYLSPAFLRNVISVRVIGLTATSNCKLCLESSGIVLSKQRTQSY